jgi:MoaA/NifB/PqqE/SkfB family radical SAM enzyme
LENGNLKYKGVQMGTANESMQIKIEPTMVVENSRDYLIFTGKTSQVAYVPSTATILKIPEDVNRIIGFCAVPRTLAAVRKYLQVDEVGHPSENEFNLCITNLLYAGILKSNNADVQRRKAEWTLQDFDGAAPKTAALHLTYRCNLQCDYCYNSKIRYGQLAEQQSELTVQDWEKIITDLIDSGVKEFDITGGEPLLRIEILPLLENAKKAGINVHLITNGLLISPQNVGSIARSVSQVSLSLDSYSEDEHDKHRGIGTHSKVVESARLLTESNVTWGTMMVYNKDTCFSFTKTREFVCDLGGKYHNASIQSFPRVASDIRTVFEALEIEEVSIFSGGRLVCNDPLANSDEQRRRANAGPHYNCAAARTECAVDPYGNLFPCRLLIPTTRVSPPMS